MYKIKLKIRGIKNINYLRKFIEDNNINLVLFGEYHGFFNQIKVQRKIIQKIKPDFFLYEMLEDKRILNDKDTKKFLNNENNKDFSFISTYGDLKPIVKLVRNFNLPIIGCDIKNMGMKTKFWNKKKFSSFEKNKITKKRELQQFKIISRYSSKGLVFALLGEYHLRKHSLVLSKLKNKKFILIKPSFKWKEKFNHPKKFNASEISYIVNLNRGSSQFQSTS